ncbi:hypothetical protein CKO37_15505 [Rubrivivax gelatinosus]|nr:hypothetical protein [Rubrivivax gelatinosus]
MPRRKDTAYVRTLAIAFRAAIETADRQQLTRDFRDFPGGACGDTSLLLGQYLLDRGCGPFRYVEGRRGDHHHSWLQQGSLVVDITADQFPDCDEAVIVLRDGSPWHERFAGVAGDPACVSLFPNYQSELQHAYDHVCSLIRL